MEVKSMPEMYRGKKLLFIWLHGMATGILYNSLYNKEVKSTREMFLPEKRLFILLHEMVTSKLQNC